MVTRSKRDRFSDPLNPSPEGEGLGWGEFNRLASTLRKLSDTEKNLVTHLRKNKTTAEDQLWHLIRKDQILGIHFRRQHKIGQFIVDFFSIGCKLAIEVDGEVHAQQIQQDEARTQWLNSLGIRVIRFSNIDVMSQPDRVRAEIEKATQEQMSLIQNSSEPLS